MILECISLVQILLFDMHVFSSPCNKTICSFLVILLAIETFNVVHFLILLAIETFTGSEDMIFKSVSLVQLLTLDVFMWGCPPCPAIRPLVHY